MKKERIRLRILLPVVSVLAALLLGAVVGFFQYQKTRFNQDIQTKLDGIHRMFRQELHRDAVLMRALVDFIKEDKGLQNAWLAKDRQELLRLAAPIYDNIRSKYRITHFYFHGPDSVNFLRVHNPPSYGDYIDRFTLQEASASGKTTQGIELGPFGTFTLRVVQPWRINTEIVGYLELGEGIEHITPLLKNILGAELMFVISKKYLDRNKWGEGLKMMGRTGDWSRFRDFVIVDKTMDTINSKIQEYLQLSHQDHAGLRFDITSDDRKYRGGFVALIDAGMRDVGDIVVLNDITDEQAAMQKLTKIMIAICVLIGGFLIVFFFIYVGKIERRLLKSSNNLKNEIAVRIQAQEALQKAHTELEQRIEERTAELSKSNALLKVEVNERRLAEAALEKSSEKIKRFAYSVSHDLKNPAVGIHGLTKRLQKIYRGLLDEKGKRYCDQILKASEQIAALVEKINIYISTKETPFDIETVKLKEVLLMIREEFALQLNTREISWSEPDCLPEIRMDRLSILRILRNLVDNSLKYGGNKLSEIEFGYKESGEFHVLSIKDNGAGLKEKDFNKIFGLFTREATSQEVQGTGLGLAIVKEIAEQSKGNVWAEPGPKKGMTVFVSISKHL